MLHPSYTDLIKVLNSGVPEGEEPAVNSRYSVVIAASKRARQIIDEQQNTELGENCSKPLSVAVDEFNRGEVTIVCEENDAQDEETFYSTEVTDYETDAESEEPIPAEPDEQTQAQGNPEE